MANMNDYLINALGLIPMAAFMALLLGLSRGGNSTPRAEPEGEAGEEGYYVRERVTGGLLVAPKGDYDENDS